MRSRTIRLPSTATVVSLVALSVALGGTAYAATGGNFILGNPNSATTTTGLVSNVATGAALRVANTGGKAAAVFVSNAGVPPIAVTSSAKVANLNADRLDNLDASAFMRNDCAGCVAPTELDRSYIAGTGNAAGFSRTLAAGANEWFATFPSMQVGYNCTDPTTSNGLLYLANMTAGPMDLFTDSGSGNPTYQSLGAGVAISQAALAAGDSFVVQAQSPMGILVIHVATVHPSATTECRVMAQGVFTQP